MKISLFCKVFNVQFKVQQRLTAVHFLLPSIERDLFNNVSEEIMSFYSFPFAPHTNAVLPLS